MYFHIPPEPHQYAAFIRGANDCFNGYYVALSTGPVERRAYFNGWVFARRNLELQGK